MPAMGADMLVPQAHPVIGLVGRRDGVEIDQLAPGGLGGGEIVEQLDPRHGRGTEAVPSHQELLEARGGRRYS